jgi:hypothetical protein
MRKGTGRRKVTQEWDGGAEASRERGEIGR